MRAIAAFALLVMVSACQTAPPPEMTDAEREAIASEIRTTAEASWRPLNEPQDVEVALSFFVQEATDYFVGDATVGVFNLSIDDGSEDFREGSWNLAQGRLGTTVEVTDNRVAVLSRDHAIQVVSADYAVTDLEGVARTGYRMVQTTVWVRENGEWKIIHFHNSFRSPAE